jgi:hypothetical protein
LGSDGPPRRRAIVREARSTLSSPAWINDCSGSGSIRRTLAWSRTISSRGRTAWLRSHRRRRQAPHLSGRPRKHSADLLKGRLLGGESSVWERERALTRRKSRWVSDTRSRKPGLPPLPARARGRVSLPTHRDAPARRHPSARCTSLDPVRRRFPCENAGPQVVDGSERLRSVSVVDPQADAAALRRACVSLGDVRFLDLSIFVQRGGLGRLQSSARPASVGRWAEPGERTPGRRDREVLVGLRAPENWPTQGAQLALGDLDRAVTQQSCCAVVDRITPGASVSRRRRRSSPLARPASGRA